MTIADATKTITSAAHSDDFITFEIYVGNSMTLSGGGRVKDVVARAQNYARAGDLEQIHLYPKDSLVPSRILYRDEVLSLSTDGQI